MEAWRRLSQRLLPINLVCITFCVLTLVALAIPFDRPPSENSGSLLSVAEIVLTIVAATTLLLGPGLALRALRPTAEIPLGYIFIPGFVVLIAVGFVCWTTARVVPSEVTTVVICAPIVIALGWVALRCNLRKLLSDEEVRTLGVCALVLLICVAKSAWSLGPAGELYGGTVSRTLEVGAISDSRISFAIVQLVARGNPPYGPVGKTYFAPYTFGSRGPLAGLAAAPIVFQSGAVPPISLPNQPWVVFDPQGFAAYRIALELMALTSFLAAFTVMRRCSTARAALFVVVLLATTPFLIHEVYFTWPKLLSATFVLLGVDMVLRRRPFWAGALLGAGYLCHPDALFALPALLLIWVWVCRQTRSQHGLWPRLMRGWILAVTGVSLAVGFWSAVNIGHPSQASMFAKYLLEAGHLGVAHSLGDWARDRIISVGNTLLPLLMLATDPRDSTINVVGGSSPPVILFFAQYWIGLPFGIGILFYPAVLMGLVGVARRQPALVISIIVVPFAIFAVYWGSYATGLLRDGLQAWVIAAVMLCGWAWSRNGGPRWTGRWWFRWILASRGVEIVVMLLLPTVLTGHALVTSRFGHTDALALLVMFAGGLGLAWLGWRAPRLMVPVAGN